MCRRALTADSGQGAIEVLREALTEAAGRRGSKGAGTPIYVSQRSDLHVVPAPVSVSPNTRRGVQGRQ